MTEAELAALLDAQRFTGRASEQVDAFLREHVRPALAGHHPADEAVVRV